MLSIPGELARSALEAAPDAMIIIDDQGIIRHANRQLSSLFGYPHDEVIGKRVEQLMPNRFREHHIAHRKQYSRRPWVRTMGQTLELLGFRADGTEFPVEISLSPIDAPGEGKALVAAAIRDVTDRKRVEAELIAARRSAEHAREIADRANQGKSRFLATASHDLRQPLQTLALLNGTLRRMAAHADGAEALAEQEQAIGVMSRLLNTLLDISKLESGTVKPEPTDFAVATIFEELEREFASVAAGKGLSLEVEKSADYAHSDPGLIEQLLRNLISNAIKYTRQGRVRLRCATALNSLVRVEVLDTGVGIPTDQLSCIFADFYQVGVSTNTSGDGYGLGLSIVKRIATLLDLNLEVHSEIGQGSTFSLLLPPAVGQVAGSYRPSPSHVLRMVSAEPRRVLFIEDDTSVRNATRMLLKVEGYRVTAAATLTEAIQAARSGEGFDLIISDYHLRDGETGSQVIDAVREVLGAHLKAILLTGDTSSAIRELPQDSRLRIASKPIRAEELLALMKALLHSS